MSTNSNPNLIEAAVNIEAQGTSVNDCKIALTFQKGVQKIAELFESSTSEGSPLPEIRKFVDLHLSDIPREDAIALCYRIASVALPASREFNFPHLEIEETVPAMEKISPSKAMIRVKSYLEKYVVASPETICTLSYFAAITWFCNHLPIVPYLHIFSSVPGAGKSTVAQAVAHLCYRTCMVSSASTPAALSRVCSQRPCTLMIDELDSASQLFMQEVTALLNAGSSPDVRRIIVERISNGHQQISAFKSFGPKILVSIQGPSGLRTLPPATISRCISVCLDETRRMYEKCPERLPSFNLDHEAAEIRKQLAALADQGLDVFKQTLKELYSIENLTFRTRDKYLPLLALARIIDSEQSTEPDNFKLIWTHLRSADAPGSDIDRFILEECAKLMSEVISSALNSMQNINSSKLIQGMTLLPPTKFKPNCICVLEHESVTVVGTNTGKKNISHLTIFQTKGRKYIRAIELLAILLLDDSSPLLTCSLGKPISYPEFCQHLKAYGCELTRIASSRGLIDIRQFCQILKLSLDAYTPDNILLE